MNEFIKQLGGLASKGLAKEDIDTYQKKINDELNTFSQVKDSSKAKAASLVASKKQKKKSNSIAVLGFVVVIIFLLYQCS